MMPLKKQPNRTHPKLINIRVQDHLYALYMANREAGMSTDYIRRKIECACFDWGKQGGARLSLVAGRDKGSRA